MSEAHKDAETIDERTLIDAFARYREFPVGWIADYARDVIALARAACPQAPAVDGAEQKPVAYVSSVGATRIVLMNGARLNDGDELYDRPLARVAATVPEGFKLVPVEAVELILAAHREGILKAAQKFQKGCTMLAASPAAESKTLPRESDKP